MQETPASTAIPPSEPAPPFERSYRERLLRVDNVAYLTGLGKTTIYTKVQGGTFPAPVQLHGNCVAWRETEVDAWIAARPSARVPVPGKGGRTRSVRDAA